MGVFLFKNILKKLLTLGTDIDIMILPTNDEYRNMEILIAISLMIVSVVVIVKMCFFVENRRMFTIKMYIILSILLTFVAVSLTYSFITLATMFL